MLEWMVQVLGIVVGTPVLMWVSGWFHAQNRSWGKALLINFIGMFLSGIVQLASWIPKKIGGFVTLIVLLLLIKEMYGLGWGKTVGVWILWAIFTGIIVGLILVMGVLGGFLTFGSLISESLI